MIGPLFWRELSVQPRRGRHYVARVVFASVLLGLVTTAWLLLSGMQTVRNTGDFARFGGVMLQLLAPLQLFLLLFVGALAGCNVVAYEKDRRTLVLLLLSSLSSAEVVLGKIGAGLLSVLNLLLVGLPVLAVLAAIGGVSTPQVLQIGWLTLSACVAAVSWGAVVAFWREKTFQALAVTFLGIVLWLGCCEVVIGGWIPWVPASWGVLGSPLRGVLAVSRPLPQSPWAGDLSGWGWVLASGGLMWGLAIALWLVGIWRLRVWNPSRQVRVQPQQAEFSSGEGLQVAGSSAVLGSQLGRLAEQAGAGRPDVDPSAASRVRHSRRVWDNPILWREIRTWAYGRKVLLIRAAYVLLFLLAGLGLQQTVGPAGGGSTSGLQQALLPASAAVLAPFLLLSMVIITAIGVNSIANERDGQALDLLLVTEVTPLQFLLGKIVGGLYVTKEMVILPLALCGYLWWQGGITGENFVFTVTAIVVLDLFVLVLGIHCGMNYSQTRASVAVALGTVFLLFLGVVACMLLMIVFRGSFARQLAPFLAIILGGGVGLYLALGHRNPSPAIFLAAFLLPFLTFFAMTSFVLRNQELTVFSVVVVAYSFATLAMLVPALSEFDFAGERQLSEEESG